jgi:hypothetical protein
MNPLELGVFLTALAERRCALYRILDAGLIIGPAWFPFSLPLS